MLNIGATRATGARLKTLTLGKKLLF